MIMLVIGKGLTQWALVPLWPTKKPTILQKHQTVTKTFGCTTKTIQGINLMGFCAPWLDSYLHNWINPPNLGHQTLMALRSTTPMCALKQFKTIIKSTYPNDVYKSMYVEYPYSSTTKNNVNKNQQEELGMTDLNPLNQLMVTSAIKSPAPLPPPSTNLRGKYIRISDLDKAHRIL